ncbi:hypothetical protein ACI0FR_01648 [Paenochrobactrum sp. BZR 201-1]
MRIWFACTHWRILAAHPDHRIHRVRAGLLAHGSMLSSRLPDSFLSVTYWLYARRSQLRVSSGLAPDSLLSFRRQPENHDGVKL